MRSRYDIYRYVEYICYTKPKTKKPLKTQQTSRKLRIVRRQRDIYTKFIVLSASLIFSSASHSPINYIQYP